MSRILSGAREALAIAKGEMDQSEYEIHVRRITPSDFAYWTPEKTTMPSEAAYNDLDLVSTSMAHISELIDRAMDLTKPEETKQ